MELREILTNLLADKTDLVQPQFIPDPAPRIPAYTTEETYLQLRLVQMFLKYSRKLYQEQYPVVHALIRFAGLDGTVEVSQVISPFAPGTIDTNKFEKVITVNQNLLGPVLYRGGDVELMLGLYAAPGDDWAQRFIGLAQGVSMFALQGPLSAAVSLATPIKQSLESVLGSNRLQFKLGFNAPLRPGDWLKPGYLALIDAPNISSAGIAVRNETLYSGNNPYEDHDYMLIAIEGFTQRSDWQRVGLGRLWTNLLKTAAEEDDKERVRQIYTQFSGAVVSSEDLSWADRNALVTLAQERVVAIRKARTADFLDAVKGMGGRSPEQVSIEDMRRAAKAAPKTPEEMVSTAWL